MALSAGAGGGEGIDGEGGGGGERGSEDIGRARIGESERDHTEGGRGEEG